MANIVISFYAPKQTAFFALFLSNEQLKMTDCFCCPQKEGDFLAKVVGLGEKVDSFSQAAVERDCVGRVVPSRARNAHSASFRFSAFTSSPFACNRLIYRWLRVKDSLRKRVLKSFVIACRTVCCV